MLNQRFCTHRQLLVPETVFYSPEHICEPCRTTLPAFHINKHRLADLNDKAKHAVELLSASAVLQTLKTDLTISSLYGNLSSTLFLIQV